MTAVPPVVPPLSEAFVREALKLEHQLCFALYAASGVMTRAYRDLLAPLGLTYPQYLVMMALWETTPRTVSNIAEAVCLDSGTVTPLLKRMETNGLISRRRDAADERRVIVHLTPRGDQLRYEAARVPIAIVAKGTTPLAELGALTKQLKAFTAGMAPSVEEPANES
jgi:DNA-binding MarR family transcriptional regulator